MEINLYKIPSSSRVLLLSALFSLTNALPHSGPDPTASYKPADWNPRPTSVPQSLPELLKRDNSNASICGWVGGNVNQPSACPSDSKCVYDTSHGMVGCCPLSGSCTTGVYASCVGSAQGPLNPSILTCSGGSVCYANTFPGGYYQYACGASTDGKTIATTYSGQNWASQLQIIYTQLTLATTQSASNTALSTTTITQSPSPTSALSSSASSTLQTITSATSQMSSSASFSAGAQSATNTSTATVAAAGPSPQAQAGIIAGSVVGGVGVIFAILALACSLMRRRQRQKAEERARTISFPSKEKTMSISSYASSQISSHTRIHPFSPDDIVSPMTPPEQAATAILQPLVLEVPQQAQPLVEPEDSYVRRVQLVDAPVVSPSVEKEEPYVRRVQLIDRPSIDELADLPPPWVRPPTPPPRSPKRLTMRVHPPEDHTPLEVYLKSAITPIRPSASVTSNTSDTSRYSRTTDGRSVKSIREGRNGASRGEAAPPMPITRKPVGSGWYRTMAPLAEKKPSSDHVAFQLSNVTDTGRSLTASQQARERSISAPARASVTEDVLDRYEDMSATIYNVQELDFAGLESDWVAPLRLSSSLSQAATVKKQRNSQVPILGVPAAPPPGGRGSRLYDVQR